MSLNILANTGTTIQSMRVTQSTATTIRIMGYISAPLTLRLVSRASRICLLSSVSTSAILPLISPVLIASIHWNSKVWGKAAAAEWKLLPAATFATISARTLWSLILSHCPTETCSACKRGVPELTSVES